MEEKLKEICKARMVHFFKLSLLSDASALGPFKDGSGGNDADLYTWPNRNLLA